MKNLALKITTLLLVASMACAVAQNPAKTKQQIKLEKEIAKKAYTFKTMKEKEKKVWEAYQKLTFNLKDTSYPKDILTLEKRELICLITAEVLDSKTS